MEALQTKGKPSTHSDGSVRATWYNVAKGVIARDEQEVAGFAAAQAGIISWVGTRVSVLPS